MKIRKVDDKPMVIHTKEKAKIHAHEPKGAKIKGSNIYTVERGPKTAGAMDMYYAEQIVLGAEDMKGVDFAPISEGQLPSSLKENGGKAR